jgi:hypothetical protein
MPEEDGIDKLTSKLKEGENYWNSTINSLTQKLNCSVKDVVPLQAETISLRQQLTEQIKTISYELYKMMPRIKAFRKQRFEYYAGAQSPYATNSSERTKLVEWDLALFDLKKDILDIHIEFLRESLKNMDNINFAIKNKISLYQLTDME